MQRSLVIGYGNVDRGDDGAAFHVVNRVRARLGQRVLTEDESGLDSLGAATAVFVPQLTPELAYEAAACHRLVLVDAHVGSDSRPLAARRLQPLYQQPVLSHMLPPATFLWLMQCISGLERIAFLVSLRGHCFELQRRLSPATSALVVPAADRVLELIRSGLAGADVTAQLSALSTAR